MSNRVALLYSTHSGDIPDATQLMTGELVVNIVDGRLYTKDTGSNILLLAGGGPQVSSSYASTASYALVAQTLLGTITSASFANTASVGAPNFFVSGTETIIGTILINNFTASVVDVTITGSIAQTGSQVIVGLVTASAFSGSIQSSSFASASYTTLTASYAITAGFAQNAGTFSPTGSFTGSFTGSLLGSASYALTSSYATTASYAATALSSSYAGTASLLLGSVVSASYALTASYAANAGGGTSSIGKHTIWLPASAMLPRIANGAFPVTAIQLDTPGTGSNHISMDFTGSTLSYAQFYVAFPRSWDNSSLTARFYWSHTSSAATFNVIWGIHALSIPNSASMTGSFGAGAEITGSGGVVNYLYVTSETTNINVGTNDDNMMTVLEVYRSASKGTTADNLVANARLLGIQLLYTTNASIDN